MENENIYDKIQELFGNVPGNFSILEEQIDIDLQMEYFEFSKKQKENLDQAKVLKNKDDIFLHDVSVDTKKKLFARLASIEDVEAYRTIEKYLKAPDKHLKEWAILALQESRMLLESRLLDENQIFISTGLGGKGSKLRYFVVLLGTEARPFSALQQKIIKNEFEFTLGKYKAELEKIDFSENFCSLLTIIPLNIPIKDLFKAAVDECNQFGNFLEENFIVTNVKELSFDEVKAFLEKQQNESGTESDDDNYEDEDYDDFDDL
jgi:hypothetical protein